MTEKQKIQFTKENKRYLESCGITDRAELKELLTLLNPYMLPYQEQNNRWWLANDERKYYYQLFVRHSVISCSEFTDSLTEIVGPEFDPGKLKYENYRKAVASVVKDYYEQKYKTKLLPPIDMMNVSQQQIKSSNMYVDELSR